MTVAVLGLGNSMQTDDGVGVHAVRILVSNRRLPPTVVRVPISQFIYGAARSGHFEFTIGLRAVDGKTYPG